MYSWTLVFVIFIIINTTLRNVGISAYVADYYLDVHFGTAHRIVIYDLKKVKCIIT